MFNQANIASSSLHKRLFTPFICVLIFLLLTRIVAMFGVPLNDSTEARYGEIARIMLETNDWITPMHQYGVPFWAKPPLSMWTSALSMKAFGVTPFAARLPGLLLSFGVLGLVWGIARQRGGQFLAMIATLVLASSLYFYLDAGTVMTDPSLLFSTTFIMIAFWRAVVGQQRLWGYLLFVAMGIGLLAKGPVALVLMGMPIGLWVILQNRWLDIWQRLPWVTGLLLMTMIAFPWYYLAEVKTPGFLRYFLVGEHLSRFLQPGWQGDKYGFAHVAPYGMIWLYALLGIFPWCIPGSVWLVRHVKHLPTWFKDDDGWMCYLLVCTLTPLVFFTFASNIIYPYVFPMLPAFALLFAECVTRSGVNDKYIKRFIPLATLSGVFFLIGTGVFVFHPELIAKSQNRVVRVFDAQDRARNSRLIYWSDKTDYSAQFYSAGHAQSTLDPSVLCKLLSTDVTHYVVLDSEDPHPLDETILAQMIKIDTVPVLSKRYHIYAAHHVTC